MARLHIGGNDTDQLNMTLLHHPHIPPLSSRDRTKQRHRNTTTTSKSSKSKQNYCKSSTVVLFTAFSSSLLLLQFVVFVQIWNHHVDLHNVVVSLIEQHHHHDPHPDHQHQDHNGKVMGDVADDGNDRQRSIHGEQKRKIELTAFHQPSDTMRHLPTTTTTTTQTTSHTGIWNNNVVPKIHNYVVNYGDTIYLNNDWNGSPVVIEEYKLIFFTTAKNGCSIFLQLLRRMMHIQKWNTIDIHVDKLLPWNPEYNGLTYLYDYNISYVNEIMTNQQWTRAIFVRDPKERFLSAYIDKVVRNDNYLIEKCCPTNKNCLLPSRNNITVFLHEIVYYCQNQHWKPQYLQMSTDQWSYINFVGNMETLQADTQQLLDQLGVWETYGRSGWGKNGKEQIFTTEIGDSNSGREHGTNAKRYLRSYLTPTLENELDEYYSNDYNHLIMNLTKTKLF